MWVGLTHGYMLLTHSVHLGLNSWMVCSVDWTHMLYLLCAEMGTGLVGVRWQVDQPTAIHRWTMAVMGIAAAVECVRR